MVQDLTIVGSRSRAGVGVEAGIVQQGARADVEHDDPTGAREAEQDVERLVVDDVAHVGRVPPQASLFDDRVAVPVDR